MMLKAILRTVLTELEKSDQSSGKDGDCGCGKHKDHHHDDHADNKHGNERRNDRHTQYVSTGGCEGCPKKDFVIVAEMAELTGDWIALVRGDDGQKTYGWTTAKTKQEVLDRAHIIVGELDIYRVTSGRADAVHEHHH